MPNCCQSRRSYFFACSGASSSRRALHPYSVAMSSKTRRVRASLVSDAWVRQIRSSERKEESRNINPGATVGRHRISVLRRLYAHKAPGPSWRSYSFLIRRQQGQEICANLDTSRMMMWDRFISRSPSLLSWTRQSVTPARRTPRSWDNTWWVSGRSSD